MLELYQLEILAKRRAARIFWLVVFICSLFLYFFFQGYYPDVRVGLRHIFSESGSENNSGSSDLIRSFGIINVRTTPTDATMLLSSGAYGNNEKRMSDYGDYHMSIEKVGYLSNIFDFKIDREKPFFIDKITLLPEPNYTKMTGVLDIFPLGNGEYLPKTASGIIYSGSLVAGSSGVLTHIGGIYFQTSTGVVNWEGVKFQKSRQDIANFIQTCSDIDWRYGIFVCPTSQSLLTISGKYMTGILDVENHMIIRSGSLTAIQNGVLGKSYSQTGTIDSSSIIFNDTLFEKKNGSLISKTNPEKNIITELDTIDQISLLGEELILLGKTQGETYLIVRHMGDPIDRERIIELPENLSYSQVIFHSIDGNIMIETPLGILFVYRGSSTYQWIVEGNILNYSSTGAQYKKDGQIWITDWSKKTE